MPTDLLARRTAGPLLPAPQAAPDPAFAARPRLARLRDTLARVARQRPPRWNTPALFFFDPTRQAELEAARPTPPDRFAELAAAITTELPALLASVEVRRVARATDGLTAAARALAPNCPAAKELAELLAVPDDEVFLVLSPADRSGVRLHLRGAADAAQLYRALSEPLPPTPSPKKGGGVRDEEAIASSVLSISPLRGGVGEGSSSPFQLFAPTALRPDGTLPAGFAGCAHWLWPTQPLAAVPRVDGERVVLVGPAVVRAALDGEPRFPTLAVEAEVIHTLNVFQTAERLSRLAGRLVPVHAPKEVGPHLTEVVARAA